jgi:CRP/FNR family transcriptional regulator
MDLLKSESLRISSYFLELTDSELEWVRRNTELLHKEDDSVVLIEGEASPGLLIVLSGSVKVCRISSGGREQVLRIAGPGESLNDVPVFDGGSCPATVIALESCEILVVPAPVFRELLTRHSTIAVQLLVTFAKRLRQVTKLATDLTLLDVEGRVAKALELYTRGAPDAEFNMSQTELAAIVGTRREVVARSLKNLEEKGAINRQHGNVAVTDREKLLELLNQG